MQQFHIRLPDKTVDMIDQTIDGNNMTDKIRNYIQSNYVNREYLLFEKKKLQLKMEQIEKMLQGNPFFNKDALTVVEKEYLSSAIKIVKKNPEYIYGQKDGYNSKFNKNLITKEFKLLLYEFEEEQKKNI